jgi:hypothetical protein
MKRKSLGKVLFTTGLFTVVCSTILLEVYKGTMLIHPSPDYHGPIKYTVYAPGVIYVLALGSIISTIGLVLLSRPKHFSRFLVAVVLLNAPLLYFIWRSTTPGILI